MTSLPTQPSAVQAAVETDWLTALELLQESGLKANFMDLYRKTTFDLFSTPSHVAHVIRFEGIPFQPRSETRVTIRINPKILDYPHIERVEFFMSFALEVWRYKEEKSWDEFRVACLRFGCDYSNAIQPRQRWHWIYYIKNTETFQALPIWKIVDDRPKCGYCTGFMPTGSDCHPERKGVHENCGYELDAIVAALASQGAKP